MRSRLSDDRVRRWSRRASLTTLATLVAASGAGFGFRLFRSRDEGKGPAKPGAAQPPPASPTAWARLGANATPAPPSPAAVRTTAGRGTPLTFWHPFGTDAGKEPAAHAAIWNAFSSANGKPIAAMAVPDTPAGSLVPALQAAVAAGNPPSAACLPRLQLAGALTGGLIRDVTDLAARDGPSAAAFYPHVWADTALNDRLMAAPFGADARGIWWRRELLAAHQLDPQRGPPSLEALTALGGPPQPSAQQQRRWGFSPFAGETHPYTWGISFGARWYDDATRRFTASAAPNVAALAWYTRQAASGTPPQAPGGPNPLATGSVQALAGGQWLLAELPAAQRDAFGAGALPPVAGMRSTETWSSGFAIVLPAKGEGVESAWPFAAYYAGTAAALAYVRAGGRRVMPAQPALAAHPDVLAPGPLWQTFLTMLPSAWARPAIADATLAWSALADAADRLRQGQGMPAAVLRGVEATVNAALALRGD